MTSHLDDEKARHEAMDRATTLSASSARARLWAGLNRYLATEARHEQRIAEAETAEGAAERGSAEHEEAEEDQR